MFHNEFDFNKPAYFYKCNTCGELFSSNHNGKGIFARLLKKVKCPHCGSRDVKFSNLNRIIKKD